VGVFNIYAGTSPEHLDQVLELSLAELRETVRNPVTDEELRIAKDQAISSILLGLESSSARAGTLARQEIIHGRRISPDEVIEKIRNATLDQLQEVARTYFKSETLALGVLEISTDLKSIAPIWKSSYKKAQKAQKRADL
jgi:predicted Zn-dependent peptidase